jgi:chaperonin GroES
MKVPIQAVGERILLKFDPPEQTFYPGSSLVIPDTWQTPSNKATVISVGQGKFSKKGNRIPLGVKAGDRIQVGPYRGVEVIFEGEEFSFASEEHIVAILEG